MLGVAEQDTDLVGNPLVYLLARPSRDRRHVVDPARQGRLGLVERAQPARREVQAGRQHRDLRGLHRLRRRATASSTSSSTRAGTRPGNLLSVTPTLDMPTLLAYAREQARRHHPVGGLEDAGRPARAGAGPVREVGRRRA